MRVKVACGDLFDKKALRPVDLLVLNAWYTPLRFGIYRQGHLISADRAIVPTDRFVVDYGDSAAQIKNIHYGVAAYIFFGGKSAVPNGYGKLTTAEAETAWKPSDLTSDEKGVLDWSLPVSLNQPASLIQMDNLYSKRWKMFWQFAAAPTGDRHAPTPLRPLFPAWLDSPGFPIIMNTLTDPGRQGFGHFDFDDMPRFPLLYLDYWRQTKDAHALQMARYGLEAILRYQSADGLIPFDVYPWKQVKTYREDWQKWSIPHSMRAMARGCGAWAKQDPVFNKAVETSYQRFRDFVFKHQTNGIYMGSVWSNGFLLDAVWQHYQRTNRSSDKEDIRILADAVCGATSPDPQKRQEFGENIPITVFGLASAFQATRNPKYLQTAESLLEYPILPSLQKDRRYWRGLPEFARSSSGPEGAPNALTVWHHAEAFMAMYRATHDAKYLKLTAWEFGDYYDPRYSASMRMADTGDYYTEHWDSNHAEDAMRSFSKYIWSREFPILRAKPSVSIGEISR